LLIHVDGHGPVILGKTCRYCTPCEFIVAHREELEAELERVFSRRKPEVVGNDYFVLGVVTRGAWKKGMAGALDWEELRANTTDMKQYLELSDPRPRWVLTYPPPQA
jgi:hypothetical protein